MFFSFPTVRIEPEFVSPSCGKELFSPSLHLAPAFIYSSLIYFFPPICDKLLWVCIILRWYIGLKLNKDSGTLLKTLDGGQGHSWWIFYFIFILKSVFNNTAGKSDLFWQMSVGHKCVIFCSLANMCRSTCYWKTLMMDRDWVWPIKESLSWDDVKKFNQKCIQNSTSKTILTNPTLATVAIHQFLNAILRQLSKKQLSSQNMS